MSLTPLRARYGGFHRRCPSTTPRHRCERHSAVSSTSRLHRRFLPVWTSNGAADTDSRDGDYIRATVGQQCVSAQPPTPPSATVTRSRVCTDIDSPTAVQLVTRARPSPVVQRGRFGSASGRLSDDSGTDTVLSQSGSHDSTCGDSPPRRCERLRRTRASRPRVRHRRLTRPTDRKRRTARAQPSARVVRDDGLQAADERFGGRCPMRLGVGDASADGSVPSSGRCHRHRRDS